MVRRRSGRRGSALAKRSMWNIGSVLQSLASLIPSRAVAAVSNTFEDVDRATDGVTVKRSYASGRVGQLDHDKFLTNASQWETL